MRKTTRILIVVVLALLVVLLAVSWIMPSNQINPEDAELLHFAGDISDEEKEVWLEDFKMAVAYFEKGEYETAIEILDNAIAIDPDNCVAYFQRAKTYELTGAYMDADWDYQAGEFLAGGNSINDFKYVPTYEETEMDPAPETKPLPVETEPQRQHISSEDAEWKECDSRLAKVTRYSDGNVILVYIFQYNDNNRIIGYEEEYWDENGKVSYTDVWEYNYDVNGQILKEYNPSHSNQTTYEYTYEDGVLTKCLMSLEGVGYRTYAIKTDEEGVIVSVEGKGVYDPDYGFDISYVYDSTGKIPIRSTGSETLSNRTSEKLTDYTYYPALMFVDEVSQTPGFNASVNSWFRINDFQLASLPDFYVPQGGYHGESDDGLVTEIYDHYNNLVWELSYEPKSDADFAQKTAQNRRIARINEYNSKGVTETNTFDYDRDGFLTGYTTTYYDNGKVVDKDVWTFLYNDEGRVYSERRDWEEDYHGYMHIIGGENEGYQYSHEHGILQQFYYEFDDEGNITGMTGIGIHDMYYESDIEYTRDKSGRVTGSSGTVSSTENAVYQISKHYDYSYPGVVLVEDSSMLNGTPLPVSYYLRVDMPEHIGLPEVVYYAGDEIITDDEGYIAKILDRSGTLRCELIFDYC